ncbi:MAG TPA: DsrE family protein [Micromonosporaceae bacterium]
MRSFLFIESRGEHESPDVTALLELGGRLRGSGHAVTVFLIQNGVGTLGVGEPWQAMVEQGIDVWADEFSLRGRGLGPKQVPPGVQLGGADDLVRLLMTDGVVAVWH